MFFVFLQDRSKPCFQLSRLPRIASMADQLDSATDLTHGNYADVYSILIRLGFVEETRNSWVGLAALSCLTDDVGVNQVHRNCFGLVPVRSPNPFQRQASPQSLQQMIAFGFSIKLASKFSGVQPQRW